LICIFPKTTKLVLLTPFPQGTAKITDILNDLLLRAARSAPSAAGELLEQGSFWSRGASGAKVNFSSFLLLFEGAGEGGKLLIVQNAPDARQEKPGTNCASVTEKKN
jgi:hypothetical protein